MRTCLVVLAAGLAACSDFSVPDGEARILEVTVTPPVAARGSEVRVAVAGSRPFSPPPLVRLLGQVLSPATEPDPEGRSVFTYTATGHEPEGVELAVEVGAGSSSHTAAIRFDFTAPQLLEATSTPRSVKPGETLQLALRMSEPLAAPPQVQLPGAEVACAASAEDPAEYRCTTTPGAGAQPGWQQAGLDFADAAGNRTVLDAVPLGALFDLEQPLQVAAPHILPERAGRGTQVLVSFQATRVLAQPPAVTLGGLPATPLAGPDLLGGYVFGYSVLGTELGPPPQDGTLPVVARLGDLEVPLGTVRLDFQPPALLEPSPAAPAPLQHVGKGGSFHLELLADEELAGLAATNQGLPMECEASPDPARWSCLYEALGSEAEGPQTVVVWLADRFGNSERVLVDARVSFDFTCKVAPERVFVVGRWGQPWRFQAEPGAFDPGAEVSVRLVGETEPVLTATAAEDGSIAPLDLPGAERPMVEVSARVAVVENACPTVPARTRFFASPAEAPASGLQPRFWSLLSGTAQPNLLDVRESEGAPAPGELARADDLAWTLVGPQPASAPDWVKVPFTGGYPDEALSAPLTYLPGSGATRVGEGISGNGALYSWTGSNWLFRPNVDPMMAPSANALSSTCFDTQRGQLLLFGGLATSSGTPVDQLFLAQPGEGTSVAWMPAPASVGPSARLRHAMVYDAARAQSLLFGGYTSRPNVVVFGDSWTWDSDGWQRVATEIAPSARSAHAMAYDAARRRVVLFGGSVNASTLEPVADTWEWMGSSWVQRAESGPPARAFAAMAAHAQRGTAILFGGRTIDGLVADTWEWNGTSWKQLATAHQPPPLYLHGMAYDERRGRLVVFGGSTSTSGSWNTDVWELTESGLFPGALVRLVAYDPGVAPTSVTLRARARCAAPSLSPVADCVSLKAWDHRAHAWAPLASVSGERGQALCDLEATLEGARLADVLSGPALRVLLAAPASSEAGESVLAVDFLEARFDW